MKKQVATLTLLFALLTGGFALAQEDGWNTDSDYNQLYNARTETTLSGEVLAIHRDMQLEPGMAPAVVAVLETEKGLVNVHVGPHWFTKFYQDEWNIQAGDKVEVTGSMLTYDGSNTMILRSGQKGDKRMVIRGTDGAPVWDPELETF